MKIPTRIWDKCPTNDPILHNSTEFWYRRFKPCRRSNRDSKPVLLESLMIYASGGKTARNHCHMRIIHLKSRLHQRWLRIVINELMLVRFFLLRDEDLRTALRESWRVNSELRKQTEDQEKRLEKLGV